MILVSYNLEHDEICKLPGYESTLLAWPIIRNQFKDELSNSDKTAEETIHFLVYVLAGHPPLVIGALGVAAIAGIFATAQDPKISQTLKLNGYSLFVAIGSKGAIDPEIYEKTVDITADTVDVF